MVKCSYCGEDIAFLPFKCKYCGNLVCKNHRIPENHKCTFEFKNDDTPVNRKESLIPHRENKSLRTRSSDYFPRGQMRIQSRLSSSLSFFKKLSGTKILMLTSTIMFIISFVQTDPLPFAFGASPFFLSIVNFIHPNYLYHTIFTSIVVPASPNNIIGFLFFLLIVYFLGRGIEGRFGRKKFLTIYFLGSLITGVLILLFQLLFNSILSFMPAISGVFFTSWGGIIALITFISLLDPEKEIRIFLFFILVKIRMKNLKWIFIGFEFVFGIINLLNVNPGFIQEFANIFGAI